MAITDIVIYEAGSGGELQLLSGDLATINGLANQVYLALFGGNIEQVTSDGLDLLETRSDWWGNQLLSTENQFNSIFEKTLQEVALNSAGLRTLENAIKNDLDFLQDLAEIEINSEITGINRVEFSISLQEPNNESVKIKLLWDGLRQDVIFNVIL